MLTNILLLCVCVCLAGVAIQFYEINGLLKDKNGLYGEYPCEVYLNNALRLLLNSRSTSNRNAAISEICYALHKADGRIYNDITAKLKEQQLYIYKPPVGGSSMQEE